MINEPTVAPEAESLLLNKETGNQTWWHVLELSCFIFIKDVCAQNLVTLMSSCTKRKKNLRGGGGGGGFIMLVLEIMLTANTVIIHLVVSKRDSIEIIMAAITSNIPK